MYELKSINKAEALRYMGCRGEADEITKTIVDECERLVISAAMPKFLYRVFDISEDRESLVGCSIKLLGNSIREHLDGCQKVVLMCATLSIGVDALIRKEQTIDILRGLACDALSSAAIEQVCDYVSQRIQEEFPKYFHTWRYSPGYGDLPIDMQSDFLDVLDAPRRIGLCTNESAILTPKKSVTAIIGLSTDEIAKKSKGCLTCNMVKTCEFRKRGEHCGF